jgi:hypothetical protein
VDIGIAQDIGSLYIIYHLNYSEISDKEKIEKITLSLNPFHTLVVNVFLSHSNPITRTFFQPQQNAITKLTFSSFSLRKLSSISNECISEKDFKNFEEDYFDFISYDCLFKIYNQSYGCILIGGVHEIYFDRHILKNGYKLCGNTTIDDQSNVWYQAKECLKLAKPKCNLINFNTKIETIKLLSNQTIVEFITKKSPRIAYFEALKTDFDRLIYNFGGVLGLWFGLSPINATDFLQTILKLLKWKIIKFVRYSKTFITGLVQSLFRICKRFALYLYEICIKFGKKSFNIFKRLILLLFKVCIRFGNNLIKICKIFALFFIVNIISFAYNLMEINIRFTHYLIGTITREN